MAVVTIIYHSVHGHTAAVAEAVHRGAASQDGTVAQLIALRGEDMNAGTWHNDAVLAALAASDAIVFGSPTHFGGVSGVFRAFTEATVPIWGQQLWKDKLAGGFTNSASQSGDKLMALQLMAGYAAQMGMLWIPVGDPPRNNWSGGHAGEINRIGSFLGVMSQANVDQSAEAAPPASDRAFAERYGARIAAVARHWKHEGTLLTERIVVRH